jgi:hypothetical protein
MLALAICIVPLRISSKLRKIVIVLAWVDVCVHGHHRARSTHALVQMVNLIKARNLWTPLGEISYGLRSAITSFCLLINVLNIIVHMSCCCACLKSSTITLEERMSPDNRSVGKEVIVVHE